jgi:hypothetical protein
MGKTPHPTPQPPTPNPQPPTPNPHRKTFSADPNYSQPEMRWFNIILSAFCQKNFFFAIKLHKKKIIVVAEIDSFTCLN